MKLSVTGAALVQAPELMVREVPDFDEYIVWPRADRAAPYLAAAASDRYFSIQVGIPPSESNDEVEVLVSQEYLTGRSAWATGVFNIVVP